MAEFLQSYGIWVFFGLLFVLMIWGRARGHSMGCCGGGHQHVEVEENDPQTGKPKSGCH